MTTPERRAVERLRNLSALALTSIEDVWTPLITDAGSPALEEAVSAVWEAVDTLYRLAGTQVAEGDSHE